MATTPTGITSHNYAIRGSARCTRFAQIRRSAAAIIVAHNYLSGDPSPSPEDIQVTRQLVAAADLLDMEVLDHLIIGQQHFVNLREHGLGFS